MNNNKQERKTSLFLILFSVFLIIGVGYFCYRVISETGVSGLFDLSIRDTTDKTKIISKDPSFESDSLKLVIEFQRNKIDSLEEVILNPPKDTTPVHIFTPRRVVPIQPTKQPDTIKPTIIDIQPDSL